MITTEERLESLYVQLDFIRSSINSTIKQINADSGIAEKDIQKLREGLVDSMAECWDKHDTWEHAEGCYDNELYLQMLEEGENAELEGCNLEQLRADYEAHKMLKGEQYGV